MPGWLRERTCSKNCVRKERGMRNRNVGEETSPGRAMMGDRGIEVTEGEFGVVQGWRYAPAVLG